MENNALLNNPNKLAQLIADVVRDYQVSEETKTSLTFGQLFDLYFEHHVLQHNARSDNTTYFYNRHCKVWESHPVDEISRVEVQSWFHKTGEERGKSAANRALNMFNAILNWGMRTEFIPEMKNPAKWIRKYREKPRERFLSSQELRRFGDALKDERPLFRDFLLLCLLTGARKGNVMAMRFRDIDPELSVWRIPCTKNGDSLFVPLSAYALQIIEARRANSNGSEWVFPGEGNTGHLVDHRRAWSRVMKRAALTDVRTHDLRRTLASYMAINGATPYVIGSMLGHRDPRSTAVYARLNLTPVRTYSGEVHDQWQQLLSIEKSNLEASVEDPISCIEKKITQIPESNAKKAINILNPIQQAIVEAKILQSILRGARTKKRFYSKLGGQFPIVCNEMDRVLAEMVSRKLLVCSQVETSHGFYLSYDVASKELFIEEQHDSLEERILFAIRSGSTTCRDFYAKCHSKKMNRFELERILDSMVQKGTIERYIDRPYALRNGLRSSRTAVKYRLPLRMEEVQ